MPNNQRIVFNSVRETCGKSRFKIKGSRQKILKDSCQDYAVLSKTHDS